MSRRVVTVRPRLLTMPRMRASRMRRATRWRLILTPYSMSPSRTRGMHRARRNPVEYGGCARPSLHWRYFAETGHALAMHHTHRQRHRAHGKWFAQGGRTGSPSPVRRLRRCRIVATGKPGRSLCTDISLPSEPSVKAYSSGPILPVRRWSRLTSKKGFVVPVGDGLGGEAEFTRKLRRQVAG